jgi:antitoxin component HigA of HigAB toxin-antitoxin module
MSDPINAIEELMRQRGWTRRHLLPAFGGLSSRVSEAMARKRPLSLSQIRCLIVNYGMDAEVMIKWYPTKMQPEPPVDVFEAIRKTGTAA